MKKLNLRKITAGLCTVNFFAVIFAINQYLPDTVATHFNYKGIADGYGSKWNYLMFAILPIAIECIYEIYRRKSQNAQGNQRLEDKLIPMVSLVFIAIGWLMIPFNQVDHMNLKSGSALFILLGLLMAAISNYMGKIQPNRTLGLRLPWTLKSEVVWKKAHRINGFTGMAGSFMLIAFGIAGLFCPEKAFVLGMIGLALALVGVCIIPTVYSYRLYKRLPENQKEV